MLKRPRPTHPKVIVTRRLPSAMDARMRELFAVSLTNHYRPMNTADLLEAKLQCAVLVPTVTDHIDASLIAEAGDRLQLMANFGNGVDHIDLKAARAKNIMVTNTPGVLTEDTADMTMALILSVPRRLAEGEKLVRSGQWAGWSPSGMLGHRIGAEVLGIIGMGRMGPALAHPPRALRLPTLYHNRRRLPFAVEQELQAHWHGDLASLLAG